MLGIALIAACSDDFPTLSNQAAKEDFTATLTPANEVPPVAGSQASGSTSLVFMNDSTIRFELIVSTIDSVTQAHIHAAAAGSNGPIMVWLYPANRAVSTTNLGRLNGVLRQADIDRTTIFTAPYNFDSVATRIRNGTAYVNVHTRMRPAGEIRGQTQP